MILPRLHLLHAPTPLVKRARLDELLGVDLWIKRDDATGGAAEAGNKLRKLEFLLADARAKGADTVLTCGGIQSNHARATALSCATVGMACVLFLRVDGDASGPDVAAPRSALPRGGNVLLDRLAGAEVRLVSHADYAQRDAMMDAAAVRLAKAGKRPYVVPEGGSNGLGSLGYVDAMRETAEQMASGLGGRVKYDEIVHACGSGGTAAGIALGAARYRVGTRVRAVAVCDDAAYLTRVVARITAEARAFDDSLGDAAPLVIDEAARGPRYAVMSAEQRTFVVEVARASGIVLDPVYTGKALFGLKLAIERGDVKHGARVLFVHTGGLPGLLAQGDAFEAEL